MAARVTNKTALTEEFYTKSVKLRGTTYTFKELSAEKYEEILKLAEGPDGADLSTVLRLMMPEALVEPKLTVEQLYRKPLPLLTALQNVVNTMHFKTEPIEEDDDDEEGETPGNESEAQTS